MHQHIFSLYNQEQHNISTIQGNKNMQPPRLSNNLHGRSVSTTASEDKLLFYCNSSILCVNLPDKKKTGSQQPHSSNLLFNGI